MAASFAIATPNPAQAAPRRAKTITRQQVLARAKSWVRHRVPYSQSRYHRGYRQDCSGFVSMAWKLGKSYTTRSLGSVSKRVPKSKARSGDIVLTPGHVVIFAGWKNKRAGTFYAYHEPSSGKVATKTVRKMSRGSKVLRRRGIRNTIRVAKRRTTTTTTTTASTAVVTDVTTTVALTSPAASDGTMVVAGVAEVPADVSATP